VAQHQRLRRRHPAARFRYHPLLGHATFVGLFGNGFDLIQHIPHPFALSISASTSMFMGVFSFVWFPMLARDFWRLRRQASRVE